jgi:hypothetical protein
MLLARAHKACAELGRELGRKIEIRGQPGLHQEQFEVTALDSGPPVSIPLQWLGFPPEPGEERMSTAELQIEADEPSSAVAAAAMGPADVAADEPEATPSPNTEAAPSPDTEAAPSPDKLEASRETAEEEVGESAVALERAGAESAREPAPGESTPEVAPWEQTSRKPIPAEATPEQASQESIPEEAAPERASRESTPAKAAQEAAPPEGSSTAEPAIAASAGAAESEERLAAPAPAVDMLDLEQETPILPHPVKVEEP